MTAQRIRIMKEARALFWPWVLVTSIGALGWLLPVGPEYFDLSPGFWLGIPLLATLSLGGEFHNRTFDLLLSQPVPRSRMWLEKLAVVIAAAVSSSLFYWVEWEEGFVAAAALWMVITVSSATYWTLVARSTTGGLILNLFQVLIVVFAVIVIPNALGFDVLPIAPTAASPFGMSLTLSYAAVMFWLGWRKLSSFQAAGRSAGKDILAGRPRVALGVVERVLQSRPRQPVLNLIRKEVRLLWPVWLLTAFAILFLVLMTPFRSMSAENPGFVNPPELAFALIGIYALLTSILAGVLSMGEERSGGTFSWHVTLPISLRRQWLIKLSMAVFTSFICIRLVLAAGTALLGGPFANLTGELLYVLLIGGGALTFAAFWCTCSIRGAIAAALWTFPTGAVFAAGPAALLFIEGAKESAIFKFIVSRMPPFSGEFPLSADSIIFGIYYDIYHYGGTALAWLSVPSILMAVAQSYLLFRRETGDSGRSIVRHLVPLVIVGAVIGMLAATPVVLGYQTYIQSEAVLREVHSGVSTRSDIAVHWLEGADISTTAENRITVRFRNGWQCTDRTEPLDGKARRAFVDGRGPGVFIFYSCASSKDRTSVFFRP